MKFKSWIWLGCVALVIASLAFVACEQRGNSNKGGGDEPENPKDTTVVAASIVGTWKAAPSSEYHYYGENAIITFNADKTGSYWYMEDDKVVEGFNFTYTFNASTNIGKIVPEYYSYAEEYGMEFKVEWITNNRVTVYIRDSYYSYYGEYYDEWNPMGVFERQEDVQGASIEGTWRCDIYEEEALILTFNAGGTGSYCYTYGSEEPSCMPLTYTYNPSLCIGTVSIEHPEYHETMTSQFMVRWINKDAAYIYTKDDNYGYSYYDEWYLMGYFHRQ